MSTTTTKVFNPSSTGFIYSIVVFVLVGLAALGVQFQQPPDQLAGELITTLSTGGTFAIIGVIVSSVLFPIINAAKKGFTWKNLWGSSLTWIGVINIVLSAIALTGFVLPEGTGAAIVNYVIAKDWSALSGLFGTVIIPTLIRWFINKNNPPLTAAQQTAQKQRPASNFG